MSNLPVPANQEIHFNEAQMRLLKTTILDDKTTDDELALFSMICKRTGLDPFARQIFGIRRKGKMTIQTSIDGYRLIADRSKQYAGSDDAIFDEGLNLYQHLQSGRKNPTVASITVWKLCGGQRCPFTASASWQQYAQYFNDKLAETWEKMPHLMLAKCAESLALRKAFPAELSGIYTVEEVPPENQEFSSTPVLSARVPTPKVLPPAPKNEPAELTAVTKKLDKLKWTENQLKDCILVNFPGVASLLEISADQLLDFFDYLCLYEATSNQVHRLKLTPEKGKEILQQQFGKGARHLLTFKEISEFLNFLQRLEPLNPQP